MKNFEYACKIHDLGKIGVPGKILRKPGKLNAEEHEVMKRHPQIMYDDLSQHNTWRIPAEYAVGHHEKYNGTGYPSGLKGEEIPIAARIMAVADVLDALTSRRAYRDPMSIDKVSVIINQDSGSHFDPNIVEAFNKIPKDVLLEITKIDNYDQKATGKLIVLGQN